MKKSSLSRSLAAVLASTLLLAACGGGGGGSAPRSPFGTSAQFAEVPGDPASCSVERQKRFVRAYIDEVYLWYREVPNVDPAPYTTVASVRDYFEALTALPKDEFSEARFTGESAPVQQLLAARVEPGSLLGAHIATQPNFVATTSGKRAAYVQFKHHQEGAQDELIAAFRAIQTERASRPVDDLILDLRDNTGGFVYVALTAASMISGPATNGQLFERLVFNDKRGELSLNFSGDLQFQDPGVSTQPPKPLLPQLGLSRVFILTNRDTCSASESIINSLRGVGVDTIRIGETTCGKPYGFTKKINCGYAFFPIEFQGFNAQGFGDYQAGFAARCNLSDNTFAQPSTRGSLTDTIYQAALAYDTTGCPAGSTAGAGIQSADPWLVKSGRQRPAGAARLLPPGLQPR